MSRSSASIHLVEGGQRHLGRQKQAGNEKQKEKGEREREGEQCYQMRTITFEEHVMFCGNLNGGLGQRPVSTSRIPVPNSSNKVHQQWSCMSWFVPGWVDRCDSGC